MPFLENNLNQNCNQVIFHGDNEKWLGFYSSIGRRTFLKAAAMNKTRIFLCQILIYVDQNSIYGICYVIMNQTLDS